VAEATVEVEEIVTPVAAVLLDDAAGPYRHLTICWFSNYTDS
jgi:hypothetical protein